MPDDPAFLRMIAAAPDDDAPRLVYADALEESGDPALAARAEFIRVQCERARLVPDSPRWRELWHRDTALLEWARQWRAELPRIEGLLYGGFIRGFIDQVTALGDQFLTQFRTLFDMLPLRKLSLTSVSVRTLRRVAQAPELVELEVVELPANIWLSTETVRSLVDRGPWPRLRRLRLAPPEAVLPQAPDSAPGDWDTLRGVFGNRLAT
jgi:uncharacterized protein (TIGR02996 family)